MQISPFPKEIILYDAYQMPIAANILADY